MYKKYILFVYHNEFVELQLSKKLNLNFLSECDIKYFEDVDVYFQDQRSKIAVVELNEDYTGLLIQDLSTVNLVVVYVREELSKDIDLVKKEILHSYNNANVCILTDGIDYRNVSEKYFFPCLNLFKLTSLASRNFEYTQENQREYLFDALLGSPKSHRKYIFYRLLEDNLLNKSLVSITTDQEWYHTEDYENLWPEISLKYKSKYGDIAPYKSQFLKLIDQDFFFDNHEKINIKSNSFFTAIKSVLQNSDEGHLYFRRCFATPYTIYKNSWYSILAESFQNHIFHPTEKTAKVLLGGRIFICFTCRHFLKNLKKIGFKTFDNIIDESYDDVDDTEMRFDLAWKQIQILSNSNHQQNYENAKDIINHNRALLLDPTFRLPEIESFIYENLKNIQR